MFRSQNCIFEHRSTKLKDSFINSTLHSIKVLLKWQPLLTSFAVCALVLELETIVLLKLAQSSTLFANSFGLFLAGSIVFLVFCWGFYSIAHEVDAHMKREEEETTFVRQILRSPNSLLILPLIFAAFYCLLFILQTGIIALIERFQLPIWLFSVFYLLQFFIAIFNVLAFFYVVVHLFLWYSHIRNRSYKFRHLLKSFNSILRENTYNVFILTFFWTALTVLVFSFVLFPLWKISAKETISASRIALQERFEKEVTGKDTLLSCIVLTIEDDSYTPISTLKSLKAKLRKLAASSKGVDQYRVKDVPSAGFLFLAALVLTLALPFAVALLLFASAGNTSYTLLTTAVPRTKNPGVFRPATVQELKDARGAKSSLRNLPDDDDTIIEEITPEPIELVDDPPISISTIDSLDSDPKTSLSKEEAVDKYIDFDYRSTARPDESIVFGASVRKENPKETQKTFSDDTEKRKFKKQPQQQIAPKKKVIDDDEEGDFTIFDKMKD